MTRLSRSTIVLAGRLQSPAAQAAFVAGLRTRFKAKRNFIKLLGA